MSGMRFLPIVGILAVLAFVPGVLGDCGFGHQSNQQQQFNTLAATPPAPPSLMTVVASVLIPIGVIGGALGLVRRAPAKVATAPTGRWVATPTQWLWVEDK